MQIPPPPHGSHHGAHELPRNAANFNWPIVKTISESILGLGLMASAIRLTSSYAETPSLLSMLAGASIFLIFDQGTLISQNASRAERNEELDKFITSFGPGIITGTQLCHALVNSDSALNIGIALCGLFVSGRNFAKKEKVSRIFALSIFLTTGACGRTMAAIFIKNPSLSYALGILTSYSVLGGCYGALDYGFRKLTHVKPA